MATPYIQQEQERLVNRAAETLRNTALAHYEEIKHSLGDIRTAAVEMENLLDHTGMYVRRSAQVVLQANNQGVEAQDVTVRNFLIIGENARLEDYSGDRTACFYIG